MFTPPSPKTIVNLTPHAITLRLEGEVVKCQHCNGTGYNGNFTCAVCDEMGYLPHDITFPPSGTVARAASQTIPSDAIFIEERPDGNGLYELPLVRQVMGAPENLPESKPDVIYIVSSIVLQSLREYEISRSDCVAPDTGPASAIRDSEGRIVAVRRFTR